MNKTLAWIFGGMILTEKPKNWGKKSCPIATSVTTNPMENASRLNVSQTLNKPISPKEMNVLHFAVNFRRLEKYLNNLELSNLNSFYINLPDCWLVE
jgi:predicted adenine nucleotide alpha hydrolase (AANH) superfamily ATPase